MSHVVSDYDIQALLDGELSSQDKCFILHVIDTDPTLKKRAEELQRQQALLKSWWSRKTLT